MVRTVNEGASFASSTDIAVKDRFIAAIDVGTTTLRCHIYDETAKIRGSARRQIELIYPRPGWVEIDPEHLWQMCVSVIEEAIASASLTSHQVDCIGITTQRATFTTWHRDTGKPFHNFITWQDVRARQLVQQWNKSWTMKILRSSAKLMHLVTRKQRFLAASVLTFTTQQVIMRLLWVLDNIPGLRRSAENGEVAFGMIESWLLWKLTAGSVHASDYSCISATAMFDPFQMEWGQWILNLFHIPPSILPDLKDTSGTFGHCDPSIFGASIPITSIIADQQAAMFGECCFHLGDVKCTMGTGSFLNINTGSKPHASVKGVYPMIGWKLGPQVTYIAEGSSNDTGTAILWLQKIGLLEEVNEISDIATAMKDSGGVYFIPAFSGLQAPVNDNTACAGFIGISPTTQKQHLIRAVAESLVYRVKELYDTMQLETDFVLKSLRIDGGVSNCNFILQFLADVTGQEVDRPKNTDTSSLGAAFLAGLSVGVWKNQEEFEQLFTVDQVFHPNDAVGNHYLQWKKAVQRCTQWYK